ncbi:MAG: DmsE family decaheme c-type cytochrome [Gammaproteobacteria bacterium]|nr:DmsE family decaheme c-type cytochrome [Gammaproteobacteria bacterium]
MLLALHIADPLPAGQYSELGADSCLPCHAAGMPLDATPIFMTRHASRLDPAAPFSDKQCETCHGPGRDHVYAQQRGEPGLPPVVFGVDSPNPPAEQNQVCLGCHQTHGRLGWDGSAHQASDLPCAACHQVHVERDPVLDHEAQQQVCFDCHSQKRADVLKPSSHPLRFGSMTCSDCHDPHNGEHDFLLQQPTVNETCYTCHAEKQGPYLWEHAPAAEDCSLCHRPHGSNHAPLLTRRAPLLCQQCHAAAGHPSLALSSEAVEDSARNRFLLGRACLNCHSQVHGSNHPSGATLHR